MYTSRSRAAEKQLYSCCWRLVPLVCIHFFRVLVTFVCLFLMFNLSSHFHPLCFWRMCWRRFSHSPSIWRPPAHICMNLSTAVGRKLSLQLSFSQNNHLFVSWSSSFFYPAIVCMTLEDGKQRGAEGHFFAVQQYVILYGRLNMSEFQALFLRHPLFSFARSY